MTWPEEEIEVGPCCMCETEAGVRNLVMLDRRCVIAGHGWGCFVCGLPSDGATAVLCDGCLERYRADASLLRFACAGYPATDGRVPIEQLPPGEFRHGDAIHSMDRRR